MRSLPRTTFPRHAALLWPLAALALAGCGGGGNSSGGSPAGGSPSAAVSGFLIPSGTDSAGGTLPGSTLSTASAVIGSAGATVILDGTHLTGATGVHFGSAAGTGFGVNSGGTQITVLVPAGTGTVPVTVLTPGGTVAAGTYTYIPPTTTTGYAQQSQFGNTGTHATGLLANPQAVATDATGNVFVVDDRDGIDPRIVKDSPTGAFMVAFGDTGTTATGLLGGGNGFSNGQFLGVSGIATNAAGDVYVSDGVNSRIVEYSNGGSFLTAFGDTGTTATGLLVGNSSLAIDPAGDVYVSNSNHLFKYSSAGTYLATLDATAGGHLSSPGAAEGIDAAGDLYLTNGSQIVKLSSTGTYLATIAPNYQAQFMGTIDSLTVDGAGDVFFTNGFQILEFPASGGHVSIFGPSDAATGGLVGLQGIALDSVGNVYVSDIYSASLFKFTMQTVVTPIAPAPNSVVSPA